MSLLWKLKYVSGSRSRCPEKQERASLEESPLAVPPFLLPYHLDKRHRSAAGTNDVTKKMTQQRKEEPRAELLNHS